eukprot:scaffold362722_cov31-Prasinocladus_malaysianus.AAC.1
MARDMGTAFQNRSDLRSPICLALGRICRQARERAAEVGILEKAGVLGAGPVFSATVAESEDQDDMDSLVATDRLTR